MTTVMKFTGSCLQNQALVDVLIFGSAEFPNTPLYSSRTQASRSEGVAMKRRNVTLSGFVRGMNHYEVRMRLAALQAMSAYNHLNFFYQVNDLIVISAQVYIDSIDEPSDWKEYNAKYSITFHFFTCPCPGSPVGSPVTVITHDTKDEEDVYVFSPPPIFSIESTDVKEGPYACSSTLGNVELGRKIVMKYSGILCDATNAGLVVKMNELSSIIKNDFIITYGEWSQWVFVESPVTYSASDFTTHVTYQFSVSYHDSDIYSIESKVLFTRQHNHANISIRKYCGTVDVDEFMESGQYITYSLTMMAVDRTKTRELLGVEFSKMIVFGGVHMEGGTEEWNGDGSMSVTSRYYHKTPVLPLVEVDSVIPFVLSAFECTHEPPKIP